MVLKKKPILDVGVLRLDNIQYHIRIYAVKPVPRRWGGKRLYSDNIHRGCYSAAPLGDQAAGTMSQFSYSVTLS